jgi:hypothetical protein
MIFNCVFLFVQRVLSSSYTPRRDGKNRGIPKSLFYLFSPSLSLKKSINIYKNGGKKREREAQKDMV